MKPLLLLIPGMLNTSDVWRDVATPLNGDAEVRIADVRTQPSIADMARDAWAMLSDVGSDRSIAVCGFSMGGYVAMEMLARPARRIDALALLSTSARPDTEAAVARRQATAAALARDFDGTLLDIARAMTHPSTQQNASLMALLVAMMRRVGRDVAARQISAIVGRADPRAALARLRIPVLVACGEDDRVTPPAMSAELAALVEGARLEWITDAGHMAPFEQPKRVAELLRGLMDAGPHPTLDRHVLTTARVPGTNRSH